MRRTGTLAVALLALAVALPAFAADAAKGKILFGYAGHDCLSCHPQANDSAAFGPSLCGLIGREAGTYPRYTRFSDALKSARIVWTPARLGQFLTMPMLDVKGTRMGFAGIADATERADLIAYLRLENAGELCLWDRLTPF